jgi:L-lactate dehydrogenase complex protein LldG
VNENSTSREKILSRLRAAQANIQPVEAVQDHLPMVPAIDPAPAALLELFVEQARLLTSEVYLPAGPDEAIRQILDLLGDDPKVMGWAFTHLPLPGLAEVLVEKGIQVSVERDAGVRVGLTGADAALAATGSLILQTGPGKPRIASLLPLVHIAVIQQSQILPDLEAWVAVQRRQGVDAFQAISSAMIISGPSRTADIAKQLILGMHGPRELHIFVLAE